MAQRSPLNPRYQKHSKPEGKTRKSAASAKPKRAASESPGSKSSSSSSTSGDRKAIPPLPPEIKPWRTVWWGMLLVGTAAALGAFLIRNQPDKTLGTALLIVAYACIFGGLAIDFFKVRPARQAAMRGETPSAKAKARSAEKRAKGKDAAQDDSDGAQTDEGSDG